MEHLGFCAEGVQAESFEDLYTNIELPAIAHVIMDGRISHYVVVHKVGSEEIVVGDPGKGIVKSKTSIILGYNYTAFAVQLYSFWISEEVR